MKLQKYKKVKKYTNNYKGVIEMLFKNLLLTLSKGIFICIALITNFTSIATLNKISSLNLGGQGTGVAISGNYAYVSCAAANALKIINISNPYAPTLVGNLDLAVTARNIDFAGNYAYVGTSTDLKIINVANPTAPFLVGSCATNQGTYSVQVIGNYAYISDPNVGFKIINVSNPAAPYIAGQLNTGSIEITRIVGNYAYIANYGAGLIIVDITNPTAPFEVGRLNLGANTFGVGVKGNYAYMGTGDTYKGLKIVDVTSPSSPTLIASLSTTTSGCCVCFGDIVGKYLFIRGHDWIKVIDVENPLMPAVLESISCGDESNYGVKVVGNYAYVPVPTGLDIYDATNYTPTVPTTLSSSTSSTQLSSTSSSTTTSSSSSLLTTTTPVTQSDNLSLGLGIGLGLGVPLIILMTILLTRKKASSTTKVIEMHHIHEQAPASLTVIPVGMPVNDVAATSVVTSTTTTLTQSAPQSSINDIPEPVKKT